MSRAAALTLCLALGSTTAAEAAPARRDRAAGPALASPEVPLPPRRPEAIEGPEIRPETAPPPEATGAIPLPPPRPGETTGGATPASLVAEGEEAAALQGCLDRLATLGAQVEPVPPIAEGECGASAPVRLTRLPDGVALSSPAVVTCPVAEALARWSREVLAVESKRAFGTAPLAVQTGTSYLCRGRNRQAFARLSEHAFANAVDVTGFTFPQRAPIPVTFHPEGSPEGAFFTAVRTGACAHFTTVLGPGSDDFHADHLHLDLRARRGGARLCQ